MPILEGERKSLTLAEDTFIDSHLGLAYSRERMHRPIRIRDEKGYVEDLHIIARRAGASMGVVMVHESSQKLLNDPLFTEWKTLDIMGHTIDLVTDELVLKIWTDPASNYNIHDNNGLKSLLKQNLLGIEILLILLVGLIAGFILYPILTWILAMFLRLIMGFMGG